MLLRWKDLFSDLHVLLYRRVLRHRYIWSSIALCLISHLCYSQIESSSISIDVENMTLQELLQKLTVEHEITFSYGDINLQKKISLQFEGSFQQGIDRIFRQAELDYQMRRNRVVIRQKLLSVGQISGRVIDDESKVPLIGANIVVQGVDPLAATSSDAEGRFKIDNLPTGRHNVVISYLGYETKEIDQLLISAGKPISLLAELRESPISINTVIVSNQIDPTAPLNEMAINSARSFSVEETSRFAATLSDPARMALAFAGVAGNGDDLTNEIVIRGNSSRGLSWRLEGIEIPNPNHFSDLGSGGGNISMLSSSTLGASDFYTGAFPAEFGNAFAGVFDLKLRNGSREKRSYTLQVGTLGLAAAAEGYFKKGSESSYLLNYRYSTIDIIDRFLPSITEDVFPFQDFSMKINLPTKKAGTFSLFTLAGSNSTFQEMNGDTSNYNFIWDLDEINTSQKLYAWGVSHQILLSNSSYIKTSLGRTDWRYADETRRLNPSDNFAPVIIDETDFSEQQWTLTSKYHHKINASTSFRTGFTWRNQRYFYDFKGISSDGFFLSFLENEGNTNLMDAFAQFKIDLSEKWEYNAGINISHLTLNNTTGIDPRMGILYRPDESRKIGLSTGIYTKPDHLSTYFIERRDINSSITTPNIDLPMIKSFHLVGSYDQKLENNLRLKIEGYYQHSYDIPVGINENAVFSTLNASTTFDVIYLNNSDGEPLVPEGKGNNYGIEITLEKPLWKGLYYLWTFSLFDSHFEAFRDKEFATRYARNVTTNLLAGKEWEVGKGNKNHLGINGRLIFLGGLRRSPILLDQSKSANQTIIDNDRFNTIKQPNYFRTDMSLYYRINTRKMTHTFSLDLQNVTDRRNYSEAFYSISVGNVVIERQNGIIPFLNYKIEF